MKFFCLLLSFCVVLLSVRPCCADSDCAVQTASKASNQSSANEKDCGGCSPFFVCGTCAGFIVSKQISYQLVRLPEVVLKHASVYQHPFIEDVTLAIWQPPQIV